ncbi:MAG: S1 RNA-binding domain-containing protein [Oscillospiraceae bacterium]
MELEVGSILTGKVTGITKFGAFVSFAPGKSGLVHISEIANSYVSNVSDFLTEGQEVTVKLIGIDESGRINLSIKQAQEQPARVPVQRPAPLRRYQQNDGGARSDSGSGFSKQSAEEPSFEDKLKRFMQDSDNKMSGLKQFSEKKSTRRRGRG